MLFDQMTKEMIMTETEFSGMENTDEIISIIKEKTLNNLEEEKKIHGRISESNLRSDEIGLSNREQRGETLSNANRPLQREEPSETLDGSSKGEPSTL